MAHAQGQAGGKQCCIEQQKWGALRVSQATKFRCTLNTISMAYLSSQHAPFRDPALQMRRWCWPGSSSYLDMLNPAARDWWAAQFALSKYKGSTKHLYVWNDMNEPSVFNGPEVGMQHSIQRCSGLHGVTMSRADTATLTPVRDFCLQQMQHVVRSDLPCLRLCSEELPGRIPHGALGCLAMLLPLPPSRQCLPACSCQKCNPEGAVVTP